MKTTALRLYGANDLRLETFELPPIREDELLVKVVSDSACMSTYKALRQGAAHKRVPDNVAQAPVIVGHEFCGEILEVGAALQNRYTPGGKFAIQPAQRDSYDACGYSFPHLGGCSQYGIIPACYAARDNVLLYEGDAYFHGSLTEPISCVIGAAHACYHTSLGEYVHRMGIRESGSVAVLAGCGPMGIALLDYLIHCDRRPARLVVTDIAADRLQRAAALLPVEEAARNGVEMHYLNTAGSDDPVALVKSLNGGAGWDDVFVFAPVPAVVEQGDALLGYDGCLNFFAGPNDPDFTARFNFYNVHYNATHIVGTSGGNTDDMREALALAGDGRINPSILLTHIGGLDAAGQVIQNLPDIPGFKKLIYTHIALPLTAIAEFGEKGRDDPLFAALHEICQRHNGLWSAEAERYLLEHAPAI